MDTEVIVVDGQVGRDYMYNDFYPVEDSEIRLANKELWDQFYQLGTEMIITKSGRRMFPHLVAKVSRLDPNAHYCVFLEMSLSNRSRFKFSSAGGWSPAGQEESQSPHRIYMHPESPSKGSHWMSQDISFSRVKLTNTCSPPSGQVVLSSMHKYQPKILLLKSSNPQSLGWAPTKSFVFPETQFIAVTAYQNEKITKLKINYNPFAKGFRENGKSTTKRKQIGSEQPDSPCSKKSTTPSPPPQIEDKGILASRRSAAPVVPLYSRYYYPSYSLYQPQWWTTTIPLYYQYPNPYRLPVNDLSKQQEIKKPKKMTDFSINTIMNS